MLEKHKNVLTREQLFESNRKWAAANVARDPEFFKILSDQQSPDYF
ncbi:MAG: carbonic anhydrase, partial [Glaciimonas sp.]|nr:carbonic anhydrase [Glaciimonas sp.]